MRPPLITLNINERVAVRLTTQGQHLVGTWPSGNIPWLEPHPDVKPEWAYIYVVELHRLLPLLANNHPHHVIASGDIMVLTPLQLEIWDLHMKSQRERNPKNATQTP